MTTLSFEHLASLDPDAVITHQFWKDQIGSARCSTELGRTRQVGGVAMMAADEHVATEFETGVLNLLFNDAGISGGQSIVGDDEAGWTARSRSRGARCSTARAHSCRCCGRPTARRSSTVRASTACGHVSARTARTPATAPPSSP